MHVTINGTAYWYELQGDGEPVVLLHGFTGTAGTWTNLIQDMADTFQVLTLDLPGHGRTGQDPAKTMETFCRDLAGLLDELEWQQVYLIGYSMGGRAALSFALVYPERVASLILESASPGLDGKTERETRRQRDENLAQWIELDGIEAFVAYWENIPLFQSQKQLPKAVRDQLRAERLSHSEKGLAQSLRYMGTGKQPSWWGLLEQLRLPVLLLTGEWDQKFINLNQAMERLLPEAEHIVIKGAGHAIHVEQPATFGKIVNEYLQSS
ncbi:2-succinyl-6-hydroxy-2,4-cyclohexadiene-1-carboxylate synthase [Lentibacillus salinarum]|uniref:Putative 2-succinyl-6-hydroxy-2,4-cyclohexadiene-1-carboxylate synthase n=1 Tax=Lentibacillus salinarum TaxID=446820 RepID=A0ABW3ZSR5_9BACI